MRLELLDHVAYEGGVVDAQGNELPPAMAFIVRATNTGNKFLQKCQLTFGEKERYNYPASGYFDLRPGEYRDIPVLRVNARGSDPRAFVYFLRNEDWKIECNGPSWLTGPAVYEIKALSADTHPSTLNVRLIFDTERPRYGGFSTGLRVQGRSRTARSTWNGRCWKKRSNRGSSTSVKRTTSASTTEIARATTKPAATTERPICAGQPTGSASSRLGEVAGPMPTYGDSGRRPSRAERHSAVIGEIKSVA